ncbi:sorcin-like isoform X2 [Babylonia areolata]|uniref:sorcin-like isoform X2 n=1 Tax=Babylonia areolata TaxID=304850 RepID=UPI003FD1E98A
MYGSSYPMGQQGFPGAQQHQFAMQQHQAQQHMAMYQQQRNQHYQHYHQQSQHYGQYGQFFNNSVFSVNAWQAFSFQSPGDLEAVFHGIMTENPENRRSKDGFMQFEEFMELQQCLIAWHKVFCQHDADRSGYMDARELVTVIQQLFGFQIQQPTLTTILKRYSRVVAPNSRCILAFDDFVALCVRLRAYTDAFRKRDAQEHGGETGACHFGYDDFLQCVMCL